MLGHLLRNTDLRQMLDFVTPAFWQVVPVTETMRTAKTLASNHRHPPQDLIALLQAAQSGVEGLEAEREGLAKNALWQNMSRHNLSVEEKKAQGERLLRLYFWQIMHADTAVLDLRPARLSCRASKTQWSPNQYLIRWPSAFLENLRGLYRGFYQDDDALFEKSLQALNMEPAKETFLQHFGEGQEAVVFHTRNLIFSLHHSFVACRNAKKKLSGSFLALGLYLTTLYQSLELLKVPLDVRKAFSDMERSAGRY